MKKVFYILLILGFTGCSKSKKLHNRLLGKWNIESIKGNVVKGTLQTDFEDINVGYFEFKEVTTLATPQDLNYELLVHTKPGGPVVFAEIEKNVGWENTGDVITTDNHDKKIVKWAVVSNGKTTQTWSANYYIASEDKNVNISSMVLKKQ